jgi:hypothetical protein
VTETKWARAISEVLLEEASRTGRPVPGAKLRALLQKRAAVDGLVIPPATPFAEFVASVAPDVTIIRQRGSDVLVIPAERKDLLPKGPDFHIRKDLFEAFTTIGTTVSPWYNLELDDVVWRRKDELSLGGEIEIPPATMETEGRFRKAPERSRSCTGRAPTAARILKNRLPPRPIAAVASISKQ